ncbi:MAG: hypothetical protein RL172_2413 [Bacteroidota bacterium]
MHRKHFLKLSLLSPLAAATKPLQLLPLLAQAAVAKTDNVIFYKAGQPAYDVLKQCFNKRIHKMPALVAQCKNTAGVAEAVQYALEHNMPVAVKSGGHCMEGFSCNEGGLVINLSALKQIEWIDNNTVQLGPACRLSEIYDALLPQKKIIPGGSCAGVGIGGLVLGGGYGLMARRFGLTCDSLQAVTMVDGTGKIVTASGNDELMWACRGGNNGNFGVVTSLTFKTHTAPATMHSFRFRAYKTSTDRSKKIIAEWFKLTAALPPECFSALVQNGHTLYILLTNTGRHTTAVQYVVNQLKQLTDKTTSTGQLPLVKALKAYYGKTQPLYFKNASAGLYKRFDDIAPVIDKVLDIVQATPGMLYQVNTLGGNIVNDVLEKQSAFPHRAYPYFSELQAYWEEPNRQQHLLQKFEEVQQVFNNNGLTAQYRNYPDINFNNWPQLYYGNNYQRLQQVKLQYDPHNIFRYEQSIRPK